MSTELLDESPLYRDWIETAEARGEKRGIALGQAEGKAEGVRASALRILEIRFGSVDASLAQAIAQVTNADLDNLFAHATIDTLEQLRHFLGLQ